MKKILRVSTALFLCFVMLLYTGPMQVAASGLAGALYQIAGNIGVNAALRAIGVGPGNSPDAFNTLVTNISDALAPATDFMTDVLIAGTSGNWLTFLRDTFLQSILDFIYNSGTVKVDDGFANSHYVSYPTFTGTFAAETPFFAGYYLFRGNYTVMFYSTAKQYAYGTSSSGSTLDFPIRSGPFNGYYCGSASNSWRDPSAFSGLTYLGDITGLVSDSAATLTQLSYILNNIAPGVTSFSTDEDLSLDVISTSLDDDPYIPWVENSIFNNGETFVPVSLPSLDSSVVSSQTQTQAQAGTATDAVVDEIIAGSEVVPDTGTGTIADVIAAIKAIPASLADFFADVVAAVQAIPAAIADIFSPAADPEAYQVDLKDFFPFCIPFDLFDIVTAFAAEPEAPVFEWPISVPRWGFEYTLKVDLQEWEDIASLFRTLELTIFCVGLAIVTREKFLRS